MAKDFEAYIRTKRVRASFHEAGHIRVALACAPRARIDAFVDDAGGGEVVTVFPTGTDRQIKLIAAVAGFLAEAKGVCGKPLSPDRDRVRLVAVDLDRRLRSGETKIPTSVLMTDGDEVPSTTNSSDFAFLLEEVKRERRSLRDFLGMTSWANDVENAMHDCIARLESGGFWDAVTDTAEQLLDRGWFSTEE